MPRQPTIALLAGALLAACSTGVLTVSHGGDAGTVDGGQAADAGKVDGGGPAQDAGSADGGGPAQDAGSVDGGGPAQDAGSADGGGPAQDGGTVDDAGTVGGDGGADGGGDPRDAGSGDRLWPLDLPSDLGSHPTLGGFSNAYSNRFIRHYDKDGVGLTLFANIETAGLHVTAAGIDTTTISARCREVGTAAWRQTPPFHVVSRRTDLAATSLFGLSPDTLHECEVTVGSTVFAAELTTQADVLAFVPERTLWVDGAAAGPGDGSSAHPYKSLQTAVDGARPGDEIRVAAGTYYEPVRFSVSGAPGRWIRLVADGEVILDGSDPNFHLENLSWQRWTDHPSCSYPIDGSKLWKVSLAGLPIIAPTNSLIRDGKTFFNYESDGDVRVSKLDVALGVRCRQGACYPVDEGFYFDPGAKVLYVRSNTDPRNHQYKVPVWGSRLWLSGHDWIWIEGFHIRDSFGLGSRGGGGIYLDQGVSHAVVRNNRFTNAGHAIRLHTPNPSSGDILSQGGAFNRIEGNFITYPDVGGLRYEHTKNNEMRGRSIFVTGTLMNIVRGNTIDNAFLGIDGYREDAPFDPFVTNHQYEVDIYDNVITRVSSARLGIQQQWVNARIFRNTMQDGHVGFALVGAFGGPIWFVRNVLHNADGHVFKDSHSIPPSALTARTLFYHNDIVRTRQNFPFLCKGGGSSASINADELCTRGDFDWSPVWLTEDPSADCYYARYLEGAAAEFLSSLPSFEVRNNLFVATNHGAIRTPQPPVDVDCDGLWRLGTGTTFPGVVRVGNTAYTDLGSLYAAEGIEAHGIITEPRFVSDLVDTSFADIAGFDYGLRSDSALIDRGCPLPGINDQHAGLGPDIGAVEYGCSGSQCRP